MVVTWFSFCWKHTSLLCVSCREKMSPALALGLWSIFLGTNVLAKYLAGQVRSRGLLKEFCKTYMFSTEHQKVYDFWNRGEIPAWIWQQGEFILKTACAFCHGRTFSFNWSLENTSVVCEGMVFFFILWTALLDRENVSTFTNYPIWLKWLLKSLGYIDHRGGLGTMINLWGENPEDVSKGKALWSM